MRFLIVFGTTEGHTREIGQFAAGVLREAGHTATIEEATGEGAQVRIAPYDGVILAGSLHVGRFQAGLVRFAQAHAAELNRKPSAFIAVSLSAAGVNPDDWEGLDQCLQRFQHETGWTPRVLLNAAGAIRYSQYDFFKRLAIQHIAARRGQKTVTSRDYDLTDYDAVRAFVLSFAGAAGAKAQTSPEAARESSDAAPSPPGPVQGL
jgi:menaquinone-dependent protoporphyrinogen oxidase